jgi:4-alpha-glucanotransferase
MRFPPLDRHFTGVSVPVAALRTAESCGVGEFSDLVTLGGFCLQTGLDLIQLLPVNDTGSNSSPYSAISAFALHPLYLRLQLLPGADRFTTEIERFRVEAAASEGMAGGRFAYSRTLEFKLSIVERLFADDPGGMAANPDFLKYTADNPWVVPYAVFTALRRGSGNAPWSTWGPLADPRPEQIVEWWESHPEQCVPAAWIQFQLESQLSAASRGLQALGVHLKGDLPILMSMESADVWAERGFFDLTGRAGAPPDMFSPEGQNWGFPVYDWGRLGKDDYRWWKSRLSQAGKFFHAFRIDHVLGFFRIWRIPRGEQSGLLGRFSPSVGLTAADLAELGFDTGRITWLSLPHVAGRDAAESLGSDAPRVQETYLRRVGDEDLWNIAPSYDSEAAIQALQEPDTVKAFLRSWHANRTLLDEGGGVWYPTWYYERTKGFQSLTDGEKSRLRDLLGRLRAESEQDWERRGTALLRAVQSATDMLVCAEDLGDVPRCVPRVLTGLGILGLKIVRWSRDYDHAAPGGEAAFIPPASYPPLSVCTPSVHDTSTLRGWWRENAAERESFFATLGEPGPCPVELSPALLRAIIRHCCGAASMLVIFQIQDLLDMDEDLWSSDPGEDRINIPGTVNDHNWTWRMPLSIEELAGRAGLVSGIRAVTTARRGWSPKEETR